MASATRSTIFSIDYPLAPEASLPEALDVVSAALHTIVDCEARLPICVIGESAGAHLALMSVMRLRAYPRQLMLAKLFADAGVPMMVGTDGGSYLGPGLTLKQEFKELSEAGIGPLDSLRMATVNAAEYLHKSDEMGTVDIGKNADLVLLDADPLDRIENLHRIVGVVRAGIHLSLEQLSNLYSIGAAATLQRAQVECGFGE